MGRKVLVRLTAVRRTDLMVLLAVTTEDPNVAATCHGMTQIAFVVALAVPLTVRAAWAQTTSSAVSGTRRT